jgi:hypothetical protein
MYNNLDSRDLIKQCDELAELIADNHNEHVEDESLYIDSDDVKEHNASYLLNSTIDMEYEISDMFDIMKLEDACGSSEWDYGLFLIHEDNFQEYCKDLLQDCGDIPENLPDYIAIDWDETADNLKVDYSEVEYQGESYLFRD